MGAGGVEGVEGESRVVFAKAGSGGVRSAAGAPAASRGGGVVVGRALTAELLLLLAPFALGDALRIACWRVAQTCVAVDVCGE